MSSGEARRARSRSETQVCSARLILNRAACLAGAFSVAANQASR